jgi:hypothetical protein
MPATVRSLYPLCILLFISLLCATMNRANAQTVLPTEGFEGSFPPTGWTVQNFLASVPWGADTAAPYAGTYSASCAPNVSNARASLRTNTFNLVAGKFYILSYHARVETNGQMRVIIVNTTQPSSQQRILHDGYPPNVGFVPVSDTFFCEQTASYFIGFTNYSALTTANRTSLDEVSLVETTLPNCTTVSAGTVSASVASVCPNINFTLTNTGATIAAPGVRYAWQRSTDGINFININNSSAYQSTFQVSQTVSTWYRLADTCLPSGATAVSNTVFVPNSAPMSCYCVPSSINCASLPSLTNVTVAASGINNTTTCSASGYGNFTALGNIAANRGQAIYITHTVSNPNSNLHSLGIWLDVNQNGVFEQSEFSFSGPFTAATNSSVYYIPPSALTGNTRLRIKTTGSSTISATGACFNDLQSGETEDYSVTIGNAPDCSGAVSAGTIATVASICPSTNFTITATNATVNQGQVRYAWQVSADNVNWTNINNTGYLIQPLTISQNTASFYRLVDTCLASGQTAISNVLSVAMSNIFTCNCLPPVASNCSNYGIDSVSFHTIRNASTCSANGYGNFTGISTTVENGSNVPIYIKLKSPAGINKFATVWIDFNRNGLLDNSELVFTQGTTGSVVAGNITVPHNIQPGEALMRVAMSTSPLLSGCAFFTTGETEDYKVILNTVNPVGNKFAYHVKQTATGLNSGSSWANAFTSLTSAFALVQPGDTIKIAKGTYTPSTFAPTTFALKDSVVIWGGYPDTGNPTNADRNPSEFPTILSGEVGSPVSITDNTKVILTASNVKGFWVDGVIVERAYNAAPSDYGPIYVNASTGGLFKNMVVRNNVTVSTGGGNGNGLNAIGSKLTLLNCVIENNETTGLFGPRPVLNIAAKSDVQLINAVVAKNRSSSSFDVVYSNLKITNSTFFKNFGFNAVRDTSNLVLENSIFYFNGNNFNADSVEFKKDAFSTITLNNSITEVYRTTNFVGQNPRFVDTARIAGADGQYFTADDGLRLTSPCSPAINMGNNGFVAAVATDITGAPRIRNGVVDMGPYEVQGAIAPQSAVLYVKKSATGLNDGSSWANAFTDLQAALAACSDSIKVAKGSYPVSLTDPTASIRLTNNRVIMGGYPDTGSPTNGDIDTKLYPTQIDGRVNATQKCFNPVSSINNDSTCRMIGFEIINTAPYSAVSDYATVKVAYKSAPYFENIQLNSINNEAFNLIRVTDESRPVFYKCTIYNRYTRVNSTDGIRAITVDKGSAPLFRRCYIGRDTTAATQPPNTGGILFFTNTGGTLDSCTFFRASHNAIINESSNTVIQNSVFTKGLGRSISNNAATLLLTNTVFNDTANTANVDYYGGTLANIGGSDVTVVKCRFNNAYVYKEGGACFNENSTALFKNCVFNNCKSATSGGAFFNKGGKLRLLNCISYYSSSGNGYSNQSQFLVASAGSSTSIVNSTIITNTIGGNRVISCDTLRLYNSILWRYGYTANIASINNDIEVVAPNNPAVCDIRHSILFKQTNTVLTNTLVGINPRLTNLTNIEGVDGIAYTADDALKPATGSPAVNTGNNGLNPEALDILDSNRVFNGTIDMGAYEVQEAATTAKTYYVKANAAPGGDGLSWATAYNSLQTAVLNNNADTIKVAEGMYKPASANRDSCFNIYRGLTLLGGYPSTGNPTDAQRNPTAYPTVLSGDIGQPNNNADNSNNVVQVHCPDTTVLIDGFTIERGNCNKRNPLALGGAGIYTIGTKALGINNCILQNNQSLDYGGGLFGTESRLTVTKTVLRNNTSQVGGGFYIDTYPFIYFGKTVLEGNKGGAGTIAGSGAHNNNVRFENTVVYRNEGYPAGFNIANNAYVNIINCSFVQNNNTVPQPGIAILCRGVSSGSDLNTRVFNSIFYGNTAAGVIPSYDNNDFSLVNVTVPIPSFNLSYSATPNNQTGNTTGGIKNDSVTFKNLNNGPGPDGVWMTPDDGLQAGAFSSSIDKGDTGFAVAYGLTQDILDSARVKNLKVDMGPYEGVTSVLATLCPPNDTATFTSTFTGASYQWQVDTGNAVFTNTADNANYTGTNTATLKIINIPSAWYGYRYRCLLPNGTFDKVNQLKFAATWTGAVSNAWENPANWSCGRVPDQYTDVTINNSTVVISSNITIRSLRLNFGANVTVGAGYGLTVLY